MIGWMSLLMLKPRIDRLLQIIMFSTKSGAARRLGLRIPNPPLLILRWHISFEMCGSGSSVNRFSRSWRKEVVMEFISEVRSPVQLY